MTNKINVPHSIQKRSNTCGQTALRMILGYYDDIVSEAELLKDVKLHSFGSFSTDLGVIALKRGFKANAYTFNLSLFGPESLKFNSEVTGKVLGNITPKPSDKMVFESINSYLKSGGRLFYSPPSLQLLEQLITNKTPVLISVNTAALKNFHRNWNNGHYLVVNGFSDSAFSVLDPNPTNNKAEYEIEKGTLLASWIINSTRSSDYLMYFSK